MSFQQILQAALQLPANDRCQLVEMLQASLPPRSELSKEWLEEIERRSEEIRSGKVQGIPWEEVKEKVRQGVRSDG